MANQWTSPRDTDDSSRADEEQIRGVVDEGDEEFDEDSDDLDEEEEDDEESSTF